MTRDTQRLHGEPDLPNDTEMYAALWAATPFPRLPDGAPVEIKNLAIDIHDPKRVYAIHKAARRHQFHLLVERYIIQIRYGCQSNTCTTKTCFSCRKRLAGGAPVRRYNATSARTLAIYMASQDNPEHGLCHHSEQPVTSTKRIPKSKRALIVDEKSTKNSQDGLTMHGDTEKTPTTITAHRSNSPRSVGQGKTSGSKIDGESGDKHSDDSSWLKAQVLDKPSKLDHRSFVQNVFGTVAFRMVEWLTPQNLQKLSTTRDTAVDEQTDSILPDPGHPAEDAQKDSLTINEEKPILQAEPDAPALPIDQDNEIVEATKPQRPKSSGLKSQPKPATSQPLDSFQKPPFDERPPPKRKSSHVRTSSESIDHHKPKSILNIPQKPADMDTNHFAQVKSPKQKVVRQAVITSPAMRVEESPSPDGLQLRSNLSANARTQKLIAVEDFKVKEKPSTTDDSRMEKKTPRKRREKRRQPRTDVVLPQSLSYLSMEAIQILCDIMDVNNTSEKHGLHPQKISEELNRELGMKLTDFKAIDHVPWSSIRLESQSDNVRWLGFVEQSLFDVLGRPHSLLQSFRHKDKFFDTQTIWYLMLRMTRVAPSLVFDSLWRANGSLFSPPEALEDAYDWTQPSGQGFEYVSNVDAAQIISLCLHALVASAPLLRDSRKLMNMSRIRSYGLSTLGRDSTSLEPVTLCLQYEDAFTNEFAMRLARRLFAAIPTRRAFSELLDLQKDIKDTESSEPDILDTVLETLRVFELQTIPVMTFSEEESNVHEARMCTLILDWARTVMLQEWQGSAVVPRDGPFGGALMTMAAIYKNRKSLLLGDIHFQTQYFSSRLDPITMPREWTMFEQNKKTVHLLDHPYLFHPSTLVTYFRAINFSRMNHAYETSKATSGLMSTAMAGNHNLMANKQRWDRLVEQLRTGTSTFLILEIRRTNVLVDTFNSIWRREERELMRPLKLRLGEEGGEEGLDSGGVQQEFFGLAMAEALDQNYGTFTVDERTKMTWFQPGSPEPLWKFELIGTIVSLAVYNGLTLPVTFPKALYRRLLDEEVTELHHIADGWPVLASGLTTLLEWNEAEGTVEDIFARTYEFSVEQFGQTVSREMGPSTSWPQFSDFLASSSNPEDAPLVTNENRNNYVSDYIRWLTDISVRPQFEAFKRGFFTCLDRRSIKLFDPNTLQSVVEGIQEIDVSELRRVTRYVGWDASHRTIREFWSVVKKYDLDQKRKLLEFITASDRIPVGGMRNLQFTLQKNGVDDMHLPTSYTCFGILLLPEYSSKDVLREKLAMALENSKGFGFA